MEAQEDCRLDTEKKKKKKYLCMCLFIEIYRREGLDREAWEYQVL